MVLMAACMRVVPDRPRDFRICATGHKGAMADIRHKTSSKGRLPNGHATALPTGETIAIRRKVQCRRSTTSPWAPWQRQDRAADCAQWRIKYLRPETVPELGSVDERTFAGGPLSDYI